MHLLFRSKTTISTGSLKKTQQYPALISLCGLCSLILALVVIRAYCVPYETVL